MPSFTDVLLVRHGESEANATGRFACRTWDPALTEAGQHQALRLLHQLEQAPIAYAVTSPLLRAQQTIAPLASQHGLVPVVLDDLAEVNLGQWDGQRLCDLEADNSAAFHAWRKDPEQNPPPGGESILTVGQRVLKTLSEFLNQCRPESLTIAATHADCIKGAVLVIMDGEGPMARRLIVPNTGQLLLRRFSEGQWTVVLSPLCNALNGGCDL